MAPEAQIGAILTAMATPFDSDLELNETAARRLARHLVEHGSDGIVVTGTTGESATPNDDVGQARAIVDAGLALYAGDDALLRPFAEIGGAGGICVSSHLVGEQMKEMYEAAVAGDHELSRAIADELHDVYETLFFTASPGPIKAALNLLGFEAGGLRLPMVALTDEERSRVSAMLDRHE